ncbi:hypothetical protein [Raineyella fluvialis]|uniref:Uncharacterized protein n=1 Tax=Raineyella fluvialis TaxID=2662261 RepID=A0A5Q2FAY9_9ACTN|nr:hypothetical protein [Raineyella fluvialis]QGF23878.1 hypothetical protein Rai3103_09535 [Raineyella fluvialis]
MDVHRFFPGIGLDPAKAFDIMWSSRQVRRIAGVDCVVPGLVAQTVILVLNAARSWSSGPANVDVHASWGCAHENRRAEIRALVARLEADVAFAAGLGTLEDFRNRREYALWRVISQGGTRLEEWRARIAAAPSRREQLRLVLTAPLVNVEHLTVLWGRRPTRWEIVREFFLRPVRGLAEQARALLLGREGRR